MYYTSLPVLQEHPFSVALHWLLRDEGRGVMFPIIELVTTYYNTVSWASHQLTDRCLQEGHDTETETGPEYYTGA